MDFELKTLDAAGAAAEKSDVLLVLVTEGFKAGKDAVSKLVASALAARESWAAAAAGICAKAAGAGTPIRAAAQTANIRERRRMEKPSVRWKYA